MILDMSAFHTRLPQCTRHALPVLGGEVALRLDLMAPFATAFGRPLPDGPNPALVVLDADLTFPIAAGLSRVLQVSGEVRPHWVVGVGFEGGEAIEVYAERRIRYFSPWRIALPRAYPQHWLSGDAARFQRAFLDEVLPWAEAATCAGRSTFHLIGVSLAGLFAARLLHDAPEHFRGYGIISPRLRDRDRQMIREFQAMPPGTLPSGTHIVVCAGDNEDVPGTDLEDMAANAADLTAALRAIHGRVQHHVLPGETHASVLGAAFSRTIRALMAPSEQTGHASA